MPRYYFHIENGGPIVDPTPEDLADNAAALTYARQVAVDLMRGLQNKGQEWRVIAKNEAGEIVAEVPTLWNANAALAIKP